MACEMLIDMAQHGAFSGNDRSYFIPPENDEPGLDYLLMNRFVRFSVNSRFSVL